MAAFSKFPLLALPADEIRRTIRVMDPEQILALSLLSDKCKGLVKSIQIKGTNDFVSIGNSITIYIGAVSRQISLSYYTEPDLYWGEGAYGRKKRLTPPKSVLIDKDTAGRQARQPSEWTKKDLTMKAWLEHLQYVFNYQKIDSIVFCNRSSDFDIDDIKEVFGDITKICINITGCLAFNQMILQHFFPIEELTVMAESFRDSKVPLSLLMQNHVTLNITENDFPTNITLNELLLIDSKVIIGDRFEMPQKLLNKFIKLWQKGSSPHVEYLTIHFDSEEHDEEIIMKGIKHEVNPLDQVRNFKSVGLEYPRKVSDGLDVYRMDGVKATITYQTFHEICFWEMFVWMDHCVVE
ncbi:unnamed protein product [Caenorhabditis brenneri]